MILMYDTASSSFQGGIPDDAQAILFYVDGLYANGTAARARFPHLFNTGFAIGATVKGRVPSPEDDFEPGNWMGDAGQWVLDSHAAGQSRPAVYADLSDMTNKVIPEIEHHFGPLKPPPDRPYRLHLALPDGNPNIPWWADAKQHIWGSIQGGGDRDISACRDDFFNYPAQPIPPKLPEDSTMIAVSKLQDGRVELFVEDKNGEIWHTWKTAEGGWIGAEKDKRNAQWYSLGTPGK